jgi:hypothetical protein
MKNFSDKFIVKNTTQNTKALTAFISMKYTQNRLKYTKTVAHAALHTVTYVHGCLAGKCILTGFTE